MIRLTDLTHTILDSSLHSLPDSGSVKVLAVPPGSVVLTDVVPLTYYRGKFPTRPLTDSTHAGFAVAVTAHIWSPANATVYVSARGEWGASNTTKDPLTLPPGAHAVSLYLDADHVKLWWPAGTPRGSEGRGQPLYNVSVDISDQRHQSIAFGTRNIGFRWARPGDVGGLRAD